MRRPRRAPPGAALPGRHVLFGDGVLLAVGVLLDAVAVVGFVGGAEVALLAVPWALLWLGWQAAALAALLRHTTRAAALA